MTPEQRKAGERVLYLIPATLVGCVIAAATGVIPWWAVFAITTLVMVSILLAFRSIEA